jgi:hypothetical protein
MPRTRNPLDKSAIVYDFVKTYNSNHHSPVSFHEIQKELRYSPGTLQSIIKRCKQEGHPHHLFESFRLSPINNRTQRIFSIDPIQNDKPPFNLHQIFEDLGHLSEGRIIEFENEVILPLKMDKSTAFLLREIVDHSPQFKTLGDLFSTAILTYLNENVSPKLIKDAKSRIGNIHQQEVPP